MRFPVGFPRAGIDIRELGPDEVVNLKSFVPDLGRFLVRPTDRLLVEMFVAIAFFEEKMMDNFGSRIQS